ncbi:Acetylserotonin O-methyltransferase [Microtus ochrogaster]|uniref:Acetylserotonin O-methyltransferase n=1 Tax=Microtus ochrogaster TaxID=79684 RepID=A0A8J6L438_MICOH|nr:Acetylserotonin O-methyltransferase [Microtus ochrogaster]
MADAAAGDPGDGDFRLLMDYAHGFMVSQVLFTASDLGLFEALAPGPLETAAVARALGSSPRGTRLLLDACAGLGLVRAEPGRGGGGGSGALAAACARLHPTSSVSVFDTHDVIATARAHFRRPRGDPPIRFLGGDFFRSPLPRADLYILARVLHDWTDADAARLLGRIGRAGGRGSALLLVEAVLTPGGRGPARALLLSLTMLLQTRGRERTEAEFRAMAAAAGFTRFQRRPTGGDLEVMLARK